MVLLVVSWVGGCRLLVIVFCCSCVVVSFVLDGVW